jgi:uncharacterized membrane protein YfbV (UPF0208 family)
MPSWEYVGALTFALIALYLFIKGIIVTGDSSNKRYEDYEDRLKHWKEINLKLIEENCLLCDQISKDSRVHSENLKQILEILKKNQQELRKLIKRINKEDQEL